MLKIHTNNPLKDNLILIFCPANVGVIKSFEIRRPTDVDVVAVQPVRMTLNQLESIRILSLCDLVMC